MQRAFHFFQPMAGPEENDPRLLWYVDVRCDGKALPANRKRAGSGSWQTKRISSLGCAETADAAAIGIDDDIWPYQREMS